MIKLLKTILLLSIAISTYGAAEIPFPPGAKEFKILKPMIEKISETSKFTLYEGLPHQTWEADLLKKEKEKKIHAIRHDFPFYKETGTIAKEDMKKLLSLIQASDTFLEKTSPKMKRCGGFHPDFSLVWKNSEETIELHVCYVCNEIKAYHQGNMCYCDISSITKKKLQGILDKYNKLRPKGTK